MRRAPRPGIKAIENMHCPPGVFDDVVTSGDVTRSLDSKHRTAPFIILARSVTLRFMKGLMSH